ncbi:hypothetical protein GTH32_18160 [Alteromonas sp. 345S023]|uniref:KfrA N-terminal DNA-binding domain-containing protein n=1 Tax=Alteromonas profundi TaxID=2696062 RepID=A0A7X5LPD5_9ALTE|nr:hypothetical protein [Alteromonas profundi]NDV93096.1 hypothetical protein [Alteromonas profundi]
MDISVEAQQIHAELTKALGSQGNQRQWLEFTRTVKRLLPFVGRGRPTKMEIENSVIGQYGFSGWQAMVASSLEDGGFNTPVNTWNKWSQASDFLERYPYLESLNLSQSDVAKLQKEFKGVEFPQSIEELEQAQAEIKARQEQEEAEKVSNLKLRISELEQQLIAANAKIEVMESQLGEFAAQQRQLIEVKTKNIQLAEKNEKQAKKITALNDALEKQMNASRWSHLKALLSFSA